MRENFQYRDLFEHVPASLVITDLAGIILDANQQGSKILGRPAGELIDLPFTNFISEDHQDRFGLYLARLAGGGEDQKSRSELCVTLQPDGLPSFEAVLVPFEIKGSGPQLENLGWMINEPYLEKGEVRFELLNSISKAFPVGVILVDPDGKILNINQAGKDILKSELTGDLSKPIRDYEVIHPDGRPFDLKELPVSVAIREQRTVSNVESWIVRSDGSLSSLLSSAAPVFDGGGNLVRGIVVFQDITTYKDIQKKAQLYSNALNILHEVDKVILNSRTLSALVSRVLPLMDQMIPMDQISVLGFSRGDSKAAVLGLLTAGEEEVSMGWHVPLGGDWPPADLEEREVLEIKFPIDFNIDPELKSVLISESSETLLCLPLIDPGGLVGTLNISMTTGDHPAEVVRALVIKAAKAIAIGIGQVRLLQKQRRYTGQVEILAASRASSLSASEARFRTVFEDAAFGIATLDKNGLVIDANESLREILGFSGDRVAGQSLLAFSHPTDREEEERLFRELIHGDSRYYEFEGRFIRKDGKVRWGKYIVSRVKEEKHEEPTVAIALMEDFTDAVVHQEALLSAERFAIAGRMGTSLAHEINNPLQAVIGSLGLMEEMIEDKEARRFLAVAMEELERTARIVDQLRRLGKPVVHTEKQLVDINDLLERTLLMTMSRRERARVSLKWDKTGNLPRLKVSLEPVQQVFLNLVINAIQAMADGGVLEIRTSATELPAGILVTIKDSGPGIPAEIQESLFEPFFSTRASGLGLGLYLSRQIVEQHKGKIHITSEEGRGTVVSVWLPVGSEAA